MSEFIEKLSTYNLFNYLLPGVLFVIFAEELTWYSFYQKNIVIAFFLYYFIGLIISRVGSTVIEPILKKASIIRFAEYYKFIEASKKDPKIEVLSEANNMYRTFCAMFLILLILRIYQYIEMRFYILQGNATLILSIVLLIMFLFAYKKQTDYVRSGIEKVT